MTRPTSISGRPPTHGEELRSFPLIVEHQDLLLAVAELEAEVSEMRRHQEQGQAQNDPWRLRLAESLTHFASSLSAHFDAESPATSAIFAEHADATLVDAWAELESEHDWLFHRFSSLGARAAEPSQPIVDIIHDLQTAIASFRHHEAREEQLFRR